MAAAFSSINIRQPLSAHNFRQIWIPPVKGIMVNSHPRTCAMSVAMARSGDSSINSSELVDVPRYMQERDFTGTPYVPVYVTLPLGIINTQCEIVDVDGLLNQLKTLKSANIDGVTIECWWGIVEAHTPHRDLRRNHECLTWGIDKERVLRGRTAVEVYFDLMRSFRTVFNEFFENGIISQIEIGLGPCGELRYPSHSAKFGWKYPGVGQFQCYDKYLFKSLQKAAEECGASSFGKGPKNAGSLNSKPQQTKFFRDGIRGEYYSFYGIFFLKWYSQVLIDHADQVLCPANLAFKGTPIAAKLPVIHWWRNTDSHAAELTAGFYSFVDRDGYPPIASMLKKHEAALNLTCLELRTLDEQKKFPEALADPEGLAWQVLNAAWEARILVAGENARPCYHREGYNKILENAKTLGDPTGRYRLSVFNYLRLGPTLLEKHNLMEFERFVQKMHGEVFPPIN